MPGGDGRGEYQRKIETMRWNAIQLGIDTEDMEECIKNGIEAIGYKQKDEKQKKEE